MSDSYNVDIEAGWESEKRIHGTTLGALTVLSWIARRSSPMNANHCQMMAYTASAVLWRNVNQVRFQGYPRALMPPLVRASLLEDNHP